MKLLEKHWLTTHNADVMKSYLCAAVIPVEKIVAEQERGHLIIYTGGASQSVLELDITIPCYLHVVNITVQQREERRKSALGFAGVRFNTQVERVIRLTAFCWRSYCAGTERPTCTTAVKSTRHRRKEPRR